jgi:hypothetical protein
MAATEHGTSNMSIMHSANQDSAPIFKMNMKYTLGWSREMRERNIMFVQIQAIPHKFYSLEMKIFSYISLHFNIISHISNYKELHIYMMACLMTTKKLNIYAL